MKDFIDSKKITKHKLSFTDWIFVDGMSIFWISYIIICLYIAAAAISFSVRNPLSSRYFAFYTHLIKVLTFQKMPEYKITIDNLEDMLRKELNKNK